MADPSVGVNVLVSLDGTIVGAQSEATLSIPQELRELITKQDSNFVSHLSGKQEWSLSGTSFVLDTGGEAFISNGKGKIELSFDDGSNYVEFPKLDSIEIELTQNLATIGALDKPLWRYLRPAERLWTAEVSGTYFDPADSILGDVQSAKEDRERVDARISIDDKTLEGQMALGDLEVEAATGGESTTLSLSLGGDGTLTETGTDLDSSIDLLFGGYFDQSLFDLHFDIEDLDHRYEGSAYLSTLTTTFTDGEEATIEYEFEGDGPIAVVDTTSS